MKSCKSHEKKNNRLLVFSFLSINLAFGSFLFCFFIWFARFQILIFEPQSIWCKLLVLSWLWKIRQLEWVLITKFCHRFPPHPIGPPGLNPILLKVNLPKNHQVNLVQKGKNQEILRILLLGESLLQTLLMELSSG